MSKPKDDVIIQDPAIEEFGKKHSCIKRTCLSGCGCFVLIIIIFVVLLNVATHPRIRSLKAIPPSFKAEVPVYDPQNVQSIKILNNEESRQGMLSVIPKLILSPAVAVKPELFITHPVQGEDAALKNLEIFFKKPLSEPKETYILEWKNLTAEPSFIIDYYQTELKKRQFKIKPLQTADTISQLSFEKKGMTGVLVTQDSSDKKDGTDFVSLHVTVTKTK